VRDAYVVYDKAESRSIKLFPRENHKHSFECIEGEFGVETPINHRVAHQLEVVDC
jgi:hypothetical protein